MSNAGKLEKARRLAERGRYEEAMELVRDLELSKIKALADLSGVADIYAANGYTEEALEVLKRVYEKNKTRRVLYQMAVFSVKLKAAEEAERYYEEFLAVAPGDADQYVLRFLIDHLKKTPISVQIESLEKLKEYEYVEEWAYELAKLYRRAGMEEKCIKECHDIEIWFGEGPIVEKAAKLRTSFWAETKKARPLQWGQVEFPRQEGRRGQGVYAPMEYASEYTEMEQVQMEPAQPGLLAEPVPVEAVQAEPLEPISRRGSRQVEPSEQISERGSRQTDLLWQLEEQRRREQEQLQRQQELEAQREAEQLQRQRELEAQREAERLQRQRELEAQREAERLQRQRELEAQREAERLQRQQELEAQREAEELQRQRELEKQRKAEQLQEQRKLEEQREAEQLQKQRKLEKQREAERLQKQQELEWQKEAEQAEKIEEISAPDNLGVLEAVYKTKPLSVPGDPLVRLAVRSLEEDDYILTAEQISWLGELADALRAKHGNETALNSQMQELVARIIDRAERRNMGRLLEIVNKSSYRESGLLCLEREDFFVTGETELQPAL